MEQIHSVSVQELLKFGRSGKDISKFISKPNYIIENKNLVLANEILSSEEYVKNFLKENGTQALLSLRIRRGYIGKEIKLPDGTRAMQTQRSRPFGVLVAIKDKSKVSEVCYGISYTSPDEIHHYPIIGLALALKRALGEEESISVKPIDIDLFNFFTVRARAYFYPEKYSRKHGVPNPIDYPGYDKIHKNRKLLGYD